MFWSNATYIIPGDKQRRDALLSKRDGYNRYHSNGAIKVLENCDVVAYWDEVVNWVYTYDTNSMTAVDEIWDTMTSVVNGTYTKGLEMVFSLGHVANYFIYRGVKLKFVPS